MSACRRRLRSTRRSTVFLGAQRERLSAKTLRNYEDVVLLLRNSLNSYAYLRARDCREWQG